MNDVIQHLQSEGFLVKDFIPDEKIHRFKTNEKDKKNSGWYIGFQNYTRSGDMFHLVVYGDWSSGSSQPKTYNTYKGKLSSEDKKFIQTKVNAAIKKNQEEIKKNQEEVSVKVNDILSKLLDEGSSPYLEKKKINNVKGLNIKYDTFKGDIYVPAKGRDNEGDSEKIWSFEKIDRNGNKYFKSGGRIQGCYHVIGEINEGKIYFAEGFSTSASIHHATNSGVVCCFSSSNLGKVVDQFRKDYPEREFIICGDDDRGRFREDGTAFNPGRESAEQVAKKYYCSVVFPKFKDSGNIKLTDFNDLHVAEGIEEVTKQLQSVKKVDKLYLYALGFKGGEYFFTSSDNKQIIGLTSFSEDNLLKLMPIEYWELQFPGNSEKSRVNWMDAKSELMAKCRKKGLFQANNVRGSGVWIDEGRIVVNMGDHLIVDGRRVDLGNLKSRYFYTLGANLERLHENPLTATECQDLVNACLNFRWQKDEFGMLLAGAMVTSRICGALPVRPHIWITGGAETGKTTLVEKLVQVILGSNKLYVQGNTSEAGIRQSLRADAIPVLFDEFETTGRSSDENISSLIELMRASWSDSHAMIIKGGSNGNASHYQVRFSAIVSSIRTKLINDADKGRFAVLELKPHGADQSHWKILSGYLSKIDEEYSERLFSRTIKMAPTLLKNFKIIRSVFATKVGSRFGDQFGMLLAGYSILIYDNIITQEEAEFLVDQFDFEEEKEEVKDRDHDDALTHLLTTKTTYETLTGVRKEVLIGELISTAQGLTSASAEHQALLRLGIKVDSETVSIVQANHSEMERVIWRGTKWSNIWGKSLARLHGAKKSQTIWFKGIGAKRCVVLPHCNF